MYTLNQSDLPPSVTFDELRTELVTPVRPRSVPELEKTSELAYNHWYKNLFSLSSSPAPSFSTIPYSSSCFSCNTWPKCLSFHWL